MSNPFLGVIVMLLGLVSNPVTAQQSLPFRVDIVLCEGAIEIPSQTCQKLQRKIPSDPIGYLRVSTSLEFEWLSSERPVTTVFMYWEYLAADGTVERLSNWEGTTAYTFRPRTTSQPSRTFVEQSIWLDNIGRYVFRVVTDRDDLDGSTIAQEDFEVIP